MIRTIAAISAALIWTALSVLPASAADKVVLMLNWYVYGEHAPFYYGKAKGIYAAEASTSISRKAAVPRILRGRVRDERRSGAVYNGVPGYFVRSNFGRASG